MIFDNKLKTKKVYAKVNIKTSSENLWEIISSPGNLNNCHPFCKLNKVEIWNGVGSIDTIEYFNGLKLKRVFTKWKVGEGYELIIGKAKTAFARVEWKVIPQELSSDLMITIHIIPSIVLNKYPVFLRSILTVFNLLPNMKKYVNSVVNGFKYYAEEGSVVKINQFGYNKLFSVKQNRI